MGVHLRRRAVAGVGAHGARVLGARRRPAPARLVGGAAGEGPGAHPPPERAGDRRRGAPVGGLRRADGDLRRPLGDGTRAGGRRADPRHDVGRGRPRGHHARGPGPVQEQHPARERSRDGGDESRGRVRVEERTVTGIDRTREHEHLVETYRRKAKHYDVTSRLYPTPGYPQRAQRLRAVRALGLRAGDVVVDVACGTGLNFALLEEVIGPSGRIVGVDLTDAMLSRAEDRVAVRGWRNVELVQADAADFGFPTGNDAILSTYALSQVPGCAAVIAHGAASLSAGGRWVVLDLKVPDSTPGWVTRFGTCVVRNFASIDEWIVRRPWEAIRAAMRDELADSSWTELFFGTAFLAAGTRDAGSVR